MASPSEGAGPGFPAEPHAPLCQAPDPQLRAPRTRLPAGATDSHAHVCGPAARYPYARSRIYTPPDAPLPAYRALLAALGVERAVLVQPSVYGDDNRALLDSLATDPVRLRGVAVVAAEVADAELERLHAAGVRGLRCNVVDVAEPGGGLPMAALTRLARRIAPLGWHLELLAHVNEAPDLAARFADFPVALVFGHYGYAHARFGVGDPGFRGLLALVREGRAWVKFTGPYRISAAQGTHHADVRPYADALVAANPGRLLWGTDWPHVMVRGTMPNDADLCDEVTGWIDDAALRRAILVDNPARLYGF
jgi:2-pyrone-4,6-dicarboxylate lactonase